MFRLPYADKSLMVIVSTLHIVCRSRRKPAEIKAVLKDDGVLIAPTFAYGKLVFRQSQGIYMRMAGFPLRSKWTGAEYLRFLHSKNGWAVRKKRCSERHPSLTYAECVKSEV